MAKISKCPDPSHPMHRDKIGVRDLPGRGIFPGRDGTGAWTIRKFHFLPLKQEASMSLDHIKRSIFLKQALLWVNILEIECKPKSILVNNHKTVTKWVAMARHGPILLQNESYSL